MSCTAYAVRLIMTRMKEVVGTPEFAAWYEVRAEAEAEAVSRAVAVVEEVGTATPRVRPVNAISQLEGPVVSRFTSWTVTAGSSRFTRPFNIA